MTENSLTLITLWSSEVYSKQAPNCTSSLSYLGGCGNKNWKFFVGACSSIAHWCPEVYDITFNVELEKDRIEVTLHTYSIVLFTLATNFS